MKIIADIAGRFTMRGICARYNVRRELRGYYQATYIREEVTPA